VKQYVCSVTPIFLQAWGHCQALGQINLGFPQLRNNLLRSSDPEVAAS
jgi:hypothetical protein